MFHPGVERVFAPWYTEPGSPVRSLVHSVKYGFAPALAAWGGRVAVDTVGPSISVDALVPVPLHRVRRIERGFNQADQIGVGASRQSGLPLVRALRRVRAGDSQTHHSALTRRGLAPDTFAISAPVEGQSLLLVDDVITTGSTINTAARCLREAGASHVYGLALAVSRRPGSP
jgi:ComF family protein